jgi:hypothetical protein
MFFMKPPLNVRLSTAALDQQVAALGRLPSGRLRLFG